jgi:hypothetical protein
MFHRLIMSLIKLHFKSFIVTKVKPTHYQSNNI